MAVWRHHMAAWPASWRSAYDKAVTAWSGWVSSETEDAAATTARFHAAVLAWQADLHRLQATIERLPEHERANAREKLRIETLAWSNYVAGLYANVEQAPDGTTTGLAPLLIAGLGLVALAGLCWCAACWESVEVRRADTAALVAYYDAYSVAAEHGKAPPPSPSQAGPQPQRTTANAVADTVSTLTWGLGLAAVLGVGVTLWKSR